MANNLVVIKETSENRDLFRTLSNVLILTFVVLNIFFIANASTTFFAAPTELQN